MDIKIAIAYHKKSSLFNYPHFVPVHAGKALSQLDLGIQGDDEGNNISYKNPWYCELTVLYWLWKNTKAEYKGLMHYRRCFTTRFSFIWFRMLMRLKFTLRRFSSIWVPYSSVGVKKQYNIKSEEKFNDEVIRFSNNIESLLSDGTNIIAPHPGRFFMNIKRTLCYEVGGTNLEIMEKTVKEHFPKYYNAYLKAMNGLWFYNCNMSVMDNKTFDDYCQFLFGVLEKHEQELIQQGYLLDISKEKMFSRISGYLAEMLTNVYIQYSIDQKKKVKILPVAFLK